MTPVLTEKEFELFRDLVYVESGIALNDSKKQLVQSRLQKCLREKGLNSFADYYQFVINDPTRSELVNMIDCISTNKTHFFRESRHFDLLDRQILPDLIKKKREIKNPRLRLWSAACSSGEEPYTMAMILFNQIENDRYIDARILATDISTKVLNKAIKGAYTKEQTKDVPPAFLKKFFTPISNGEEQLYRINDFVKELVTIRRFNLLDLNAAHKSRFDIIFCRNVMIYFDFKTRQELTKKYYDLLVPGGYLFLSHAETIAGKDHHFKFVEAAVYQK